MTKRIKRLAAFFCASLLLASCQTVKMHDAKVAYIDNNIIQYPVIAELDIKNEKVSFSGKYKMKLWQAKEAALGDATMKHNVDVLVDPKFSCTLKGSKVYITLTGYPAFYKEFRQATPKDIEALKVIYGNESMLLYNGNSVVIKDQTVIKNPLKKGKEKMKKTK